MLRCTKCNSESKIIKDDDGMVLYTRCKCRYSYIDENKVVKSVPCKPDEILAFEFKPAKRGDKKNED